MGSSKRLSNHSSYSNFHDSVVSYLNSRRNQVISDEKWQKDPELLQNSVIQNFIKRKLTKMMEIKSPVIKKSDCKNTIF
jgi:hypothetical protein